jgi:hypothetical protein
MVTPSAQLRFLSFPDLISSGFKFPVLHPHIVSMTSWKPKPREPAKSKAELREMLAEAVRNTQQQTEPKTKPKAKKDRRVGAD